MAINASAANQIFAYTAFTKAEDLLSALNPANARWMNAPGKWVFRGQKLAQWDLSPSILRKNILQKFKEAHPLLPKDLTKNPLDEDVGQLLLECELTLVQQFYEHADRSGLSMPEVGERVRDFRYLRTVRHDIKRHILPSDSRIFNWPPREISSLFGLAQHYGIPTRLLDWTWRPRVAAYFAAVKAAIGTASSDDLAIWALRTDFITDTFVLLFESSDPPIDPEHNPRLSLVTAPQSTNPNLRAQAGLFVTDSNVLNSMPLNDLIIQKVEDNLNADSGWFSTISTKYPALGNWVPVLHKLVLPHSEAKKLIRLLAYEGTSAATIFPGYDGVVQSMVERDSWDTYP